MIVHEAFKEGLNDPLKTAKHQIKFALLKEKSPLAVSMKSMMEHFPKKISGKGKTTRH